MKLLLILIITSIISISACSEMVDSITDKKHEKAKFDETKMDKSSFND